MFSAPKVRNHIILAPNMWQFDLLHQTCVNLKVPTPNTRQLFGVYTKYTPAYGLLHQNYVLVQIFLHQACGSLRISAPNMRQLLYFRIK